MAKTDLRNIKSLLPEGLFAFPIGEVVDASPGGLTPLQTPAGKKTDGKFAEIDPKEKEAVDNCLNILRACQSDNSFKPYDAKHPYLTIVKTDKAKHSIQYKTDRKHDFAEGAINMGVTRDPNNSDQKVDNVQILPPMANYAALAFLTAYDKYKGPEEDLARVAKWIRWYAQHQEYDPKKIVPSLDIGGMHPTSNTYKAEGTIVDYGGSRSNNKLTPSTYADAHDSSAGVFLVVAERYQRIVSKLEPKARDKLNAIISPEALHAATIPALHVLQNLTNKQYGYTAARLDYINHYYLMDNVESYAGLRAGADYFKSVGDSAHAKIATQMHQKLGPNLKKFYNPEKGSFAWYTFGNGNYGHSYSGQSPDTMYPKHMAQLYALAFIEPHPDLFTRMHDGLKKDYESDSTAHPQTPAGRWQMAASAGSGTSERREKPII